MATKGRVTLRGRFPVGTVVRLVRVAGPHVLRAAGGEEAGSATVGADGSVSFPAEVGGRYFIVGQVDGAPVEVRARGNLVGEESSVLGQAPVAVDRVRLSDGSWADEAPKREGPPGGHVVAGQHQVPAGVVQRSDTPRGLATPIPAGEKAPYPGQEHVDDRAVQRSSTPLGAAAVIGDRVTERQEESPAGLLQRSDTPHGVTTPVPAGLLVPLAGDQHAPAVKAPRARSARPVAAKPAGGPAKVRAPRKRPAAKAKTSSGPVRARKKVK